MQRVSAFLPSWDKRSSSTSALSVHSNPGSAGGAQPSSSSAAAAGASGTAEGGARGGGGGGGFFSWPLRTSSSRNSTASNNDAATLATTGQLPNRPGHLSIASSTSHSGSRTQREAFWPSSLDVECDKAARILKSFCSDGYLAPLSDEPPRSPAQEPQTPVKVMQKIPRRVIQNAAGIAVFTCMRSGLWMTGSGGSGILIARKSDGTWSPPSGIMLHTPTLSFVIGVDVYDCILVVSDLSALEALTRPHVTLGEDVGLVSGQNVSLDSAQTDFQWKDPGNTVLTYLKARGQHQKVNLAGCILTERANENERFYGSEVSQMEILGGAVRDVEQTKPLYEVIKMAEGRSDYDSATISKIAVAPAPGDAVIASPKSKSASSALSFGVPQVDDPDPFGILALEMAGLEIREAGSKTRPTSNVTSALTSPIATTFSRQSLARSHRESAMSTQTARSRMSDAATQTVVDKLTPATTPGSGQSDECRLREGSDHLNDGDERRGSDAISVDYTAIDETPIRHLSGPPSVRSHASSTAEPSRLETIQSRDEVDPVSPIDGDSQDDDSHGAGDLDEEDLSDLSDDEEPVVFEVAEMQPARTQAVASRAVHVKGSMVTIPKRLPPPLPTRNPGRRSRVVNKDDDEMSTLKSPSQAGFVENIQEHKEEEETEGKKEEEKKKEEKAGADSLEPNAPHAEEKSLHQGDVRAHTPSRSPPSPSADTAREEKTPPGGHTARESESPETGSESSFETAEEKTPARRGSDAGSESKAPTAPVQTDSICDESSSVATSRASTDTTGSFNGKKHPSSIFTGPIAGGESADGSSVTTPTSDRPFSAVEEASSDQTPRKRSSSQVAKAARDAANPAAMAG